MMAKRRPVDLLITDLDNTLYDWTAFFVPSFLAMLDEVGRISGLPRGELQDAFRRIYQRHRTTEYAFAIQELDLLPDLDRQLSPVDFLRKYDAAIHAFRSSRKGRLELYPGVRESLGVLAKAGIRVVAHSDSMMEYVSRRLRQLGIDELITAIAAPRDHGLPPEMDPSLVRKSPDALVRARTREIPYNPSIRKPDPATLAGIFDAYPTPRDRVLYVGDSLSRDILLARRAGIEGVWARYGSVRDPVLYDELLRITYWTDDDVSAEERLLVEAQSSTSPETIDKFSDILEYCLI